MTKDYKSLEHIIRDIVEKKNDPCWDGYKQEGMKEKNGKSVPNCVPEETEIGDESIVEENIQNQLDEALPALAVLAAPAISTGVRLGVQALTRQLVRQAARRGASNAANATRAGARPLPRTPPARPPAQPTPQPTPRPANRPGPPTPQSPTPQFRPTTTPRPANTPAAPSPTPTPTPSPTPSTAPSTAPVTMPIPLPGITPLPNTQTDVETLPQAEPQAQPQPIPIPVPQTLPKKEEKPRRNGGSLGLGAGRSNPTDSLAADASSYARTHMHMADPYISRTVNEDATAERSKIENVARPSARRDRVVRQQEIQRKIIDENRSLAATVKKNVEETKSRERNSSPIITNPKTNDPDPDGYTGGI